MEPIFGMGDVVLILAMLLAVPILMLQAMNLSPNLRPWTQTIAAIAIAWLMWALVSEQLSTNLLGVAPADALGHYWGGQRNAEAFSRMFDTGDFSPLEGMMELGNPGFRVWLGVMIFFTDCSRHTINMFNGFLGWWGSLALLTAIAHKFPHTRIPAWLVLMTMALPTAIFWTSACLKEGPMYWGICLFLAMVLIYRRPTVTGVLGAATLVIMRPHIAVVWLGSFAFAASLTGKNKIVAVVAIAGTSIGVMLMPTFLGQNVESISDAEAVLEGNRQAILTSGGSTVDTLFGDKPIPIVSGALVLFLRPFPWEAVGMRGMLACVEILTMTGLMLLTWLKLGAWERAKLLLRPDVLTALGVCFLFMFLYTYMGNMGLLARQRLQALPALIILAGVPRMVYQHALGSAVPRPIPRPAPSRAAPRRAPPIPMSPSRPARR